MEFRIHWLAITVWGSQRKALALKDDWFSDYLGAMQVTGHGGRGFKAMFSSLGEARLSTLPVGLPEDELKKQYFHLELPGQACDAIPDHVFQQFLTELKSHEKFSVTRVDLTWDGVPFTPAQVKQAVDQDQVRSLVKRKTMVFTSGDYAEKDNGEVGTTTLSLGSRQSTRMLRVYDKRGPVRLEFQVREDRATAIIKEVFTQPVDQGRRCARRRFRACDHHQHHPAGRLAAGGGGVGAGHRQRVSPRLAGAEVCAV
jgi:hypothetical protein